MVCEKDFEVKEMNVSRCVWQAQVQVCRQRGASLPKAPGQDQVVKMSFSKWGMHNEGNKESPE